MIKLGLTGNIAAGKSEVKKIFQQLEIPTLSADEVVHYLLYNNINVIKAITTSFGQFDIFTDNKIDRKKLGKIVFSDINKKKELEKIIHPVIIKEIFNFFEREKNKDFTVVEIPLLFEGHFEYLFDKIILVYADEKIRFERIKKRNGFEDEYIEKIMKSQMNQEEKKKLSDFVIINENKSLKDLKNDVEKIIKEIK